MIETRNPENSAFPSLSSCALAFMIMPSGNIAIPGIANNIIGLYGTTPGILIPPYKKTGSSLRTVYNEFGLDKEFASHTDLDNSRNAESAQRAATVIEKALAENPVLVVTYLANAIQILKIWYSDDIKENGPTKFKIGKTDLCNPDDPLLIVCPNGKETLIDDVQVYMPSDAEEEIRWCRAVAKRLKRPVLKGKGVKFQQRRGYRSP